MGKKSGIASHVFTGPHLQIPTPPTSPMAQDLVHVLTLGRGGAPQESLHWQRKWASGGRAGPRLCLPRIRLGGVRTRRLVLVVVALVALLFLQSLWRSEKRTSGTLGWVRDAMWSRDAAGAAAVDAGVDDAREDHVDEVAAPSLSSRTPAKNIISVSRVYANVHRDQPASMWDWEKQPLHFSRNIDRYEIGSELGSGKFSYVYLARDTRTSENVAVKVFKRGRTGKLRREVMILQQLQGLPHIIELRDALKDDEGGAALVFNHVNTPNWKTLFRELSLGDIRHYMRQLFIALNAAHARGIMHRDIKPHNFLIDPAARTGTLADWGLAEFYHPGKEYHLRVSTRMYKPPELLLGMPQYDYSLDIWMSGIMLAGMLFRRDFVFYGQSDEDQLDLYMRHFGSDAFLRYADRYNLASQPGHNATLLQPFRASPPLRYPARPWSEFINAANSGMSSPSALDLLGKLLVVDHAARLTAREALAHPFFSGDV